MKAKKFLEDKQAEHFNEFGVYADTNSKIAEWLEEYANIVLSIAAEKAEIKEQKDVDYRSYNTKTHEELFIEIPINKKSILNCLKD